MILTSFDQIPMLAIYLAIILILFLSAEIGFSIGKVRKNKINNAGGEDKQTGSIMGASLGLLAFLLAFSFNIVTNIHQERKSLVVEEANAIGTLYLRTELFELKQAEEIKEILKEYVSLRVNMAESLSNETYSKGIEESERLQKRVWSLVRDITQLSGEVLEKPQLINAANELIDIHAERVYAGYQRLPKVTILLLLFIAILTLGLMGYQSGLNGIRVLVPRTALILSLATVMIVIVDLDRPGGSLIEVSQKTMHDLEKEISSN